MIDLEVGGQITTLHEVGEDSDEDALEIRLDYVSDKTIKDAAALALRAKHWWLDGAFLEELGPLNEQYILNVGDHSIKIFNFWQELFDRQLEETKDAFAKVASYTPNSVLGVEEVIVPSRQKLNDKSGEPMYGDWLRMNRYKTFRVFPAAFADGSYRVSRKVSKLRGVLTHELVHPEAERLSEAWSEMFGWRKVDKLKEQPLFLPGGRKRWEICEQEERCVTDYAKSDVSEDICESGVAYLYDLFKLDPEKATFLGQEFPYQPHAFDLSVVRVPSDQMGLPTLPRFMPYVLKIDSPWN